MVSFDSNSSCDAYEIVVKAQKTIESHPRNVDVAAVVSTLNSSDQEIRGGAATVLTEVAKSDAVASRSSTRVH